MERRLHKHRQSARVAVIMGVSGSGKTTVGAALARRLGWLFQEGDALHPPRTSRR
jgi:gluconokinase